MLSELLPDVAIPTDFAVRGITDDSREVNPGDLFIAARGFTNDGRNFIPEAIAREAAAVFCEPPAPQQKFDVPVIEVPDLNARKGEIASRFFDHPSQKLMVIAVTGTNGKTSCTQFISLALNESDRRCGLIGTLGFGLPGELRDPGLTTPDAINLQRDMSDLVAKECEAVAIEASSHGLAQGRLNGTMIDVAVFTNMTRDHLDYHDSFADYQHAKEQLFKWRGLKAAVINLDDERSGEFIDAVSEEVPVVTYAIHNEDADVHCDAVVARSDGFDLEVVTPWGNGAIETNLLGEFNISNVLAVIAVMGVLEEDMQHVFPIASRLSTVPGRMEVMKKKGFPTVVIDYAHTPDALEKALTAIRRHSIGQLWCVVGCGGDRDKGKRPLMGRIVATMADRGVITDDNPREEPSMKIIEDILVDVDDLTHIHIEPDRATAIKFALEHASEDDIVLIAGKGHEDYQAIGGKRLPFSDHVEVQKYFGEE